MQKADFDSNLCCCEYLDRKHQRSHLFACFCDCEDLDETVDRVLCCDEKPFERISGIMITLQDRLRIPWRGGAKQISLDSVIPVLIQPVLAVVASQNKYCTFVVFLVTFVLMFYFHKLFIRYHPRTKFFFMWILASVVYVLLIFEINVVPLLEILPWENFVFICLVTASFFLLYKVKTRAELNFITNNEDIEEFSKLTEVVCSVCKKNIPPKTYHCRICQACIIRRDHHCIWLDCCIGEKNHKVFFLSLVTSVWALIYGSILTLTSVCNPNLFLGVILLPRDCSDVYHDIQFALCFVSAVYCLVLAALLMCLLIQQIVLVTFGITFTEYKQHKGPPHFSKGCSAIFTNWASFLGWRNY